MVKLIYAVLYYDNICRSKVVCPRGDWQVINIQGLTFFIVSECRVCDRTY